jgi:hypothetical protein
LRLRASGADDGFLDQVLAYSATGSGDRRHQQRDAARCPS